MLFNPKEKALAFRIWRLCKVDGWEYTVAELASALGEPVQRVIRVLHVEGWTARLPQRPARNRESDRRTGGMNWLDRTARNDFAQIKRMQSDAESH